jgi:hypothetical protein
MGNPAEENDPPPESVLSIKKHPQRVNPKAKN